MGEPPDYMYQRKRQPDPHFLPDEILYRRVPKDIWGEGETRGDDDIELDCTEFPENYPHSEVWVFETAWDGSGGERHIDKRAMQGLLRKPSSSGGIC
jgi:hypothetical protein